jgi:hypothetical protein
VEDIPDWLNKGCGIKLPAKYSSNSIVYLPVRCSAELSWVDSEVVLNFGTVEGYATEHQYLDILGFPARSNGEIRVSRYRDGEIGGQAL